MLGSLRLGHFDQHCVIIELNSFNYSVLNIGKKIGLLVTWIFNGFQIDPDELTELIVTPKTLSI